LSNQKGVSTNPESKQRNVINQGDLNDLSKNPMVHLWAFLKKTNGDSVKSIKNISLRIVTNETQASREMKTLCGNGHFIANDKPDNRYST